MQGFFWVFLSTGHGNAITMPLECSIRSPRIYNYANFSSWL